MDNDTTEIVKQGDLTLIQQWGEHEWDPLFCTLTKNKKLMVQGKGIDNTDIFDISGCEVRLIESDDNLPIFKIMKKETKFKLLLIAKSFDSRMNWIKKIQYVIDSQELSLSSDLDTLDFGFEEKQRKKRLLKKIAESGIPIVEERDVYLNIEIGRGSFGVVYTGVCRGEECAVKILHKQNLDSYELEEFTSELIIMSQLRSSHTLRLYAACTNPYMMITALMKGNLKDLLEENISLTRRIILAKDCAVAVNWLHTLNPTIIHRDIKPENFLVDEHNHVVIADFGLSENFNKRSPRFDDGYRGTTVYSAPEILIGTPYDEKCDIYSLAIVFWVIYTRENPYQELGSIDIRLFTDKIVYDNYRPVIPDSCPEEYSELIEAMWSEEKEKRPTSTFIVDKLDDMLVKMILKESFAIKFWDKHFGKSPKANFEKFVVLLQDEMMSVKFKEKDILMLSMLLMKKGSKKGYVHYATLGEILELFGPLKNCVLNMRKVVKSPWFFGHQSIHSISTKLGGEAPGTYLLRIPMENQTIFEIDYISENNTIEKIEVYRSEKKEGIPSSTTYKLNLDTENSQHEFSTLEEIVNSRETLGMICPQSPFKEFSTPIPRLGHSFVHIT